MKYVSYIKKNPIAWLCFAAFYISVCLIISENLRLGSGVKAVLMLPINFIVVPAVIALHKKYKNKYKSISSYKLVFAILLLSVGIPLIYFLLFIINLIGL